MSDVLWRRMRYFLTPQLDIYTKLGPYLTHTNVLEVGFGTGAGTMQLVPYARQVTAIEIDPQAVEFAQGMWPHQCWFSRADILDYRPGEVYGAVVMIEVLEHISDWRRALQNVRDCMVTGGSLYISARNRNADLRRNELHEREWTAEEFQQSLSEYFADVSLFDYTIQHRQNRDTHMTPLVAVAIK